MQHLQFCNQEILSIVIAIKAIKIFRSQGYPVGKLVKRAKDWNESGPVCRKKLCQNHYEHTYTQSDTHTHIPTLSRNPEKRKMQKEYSRGM